MLGASLLIAISGGPNILIGWENDEAAVDAGVKAWGMLQGLAHAQREGV